VSLVDYQRALADLIASPELCLAVRADPAGTLAPYELTARERSRLEAVVSQRGMSTSCTLYRVNRITPIFSYLPLSCFLLGDQLIVEAERFWSEGKPGDLQFGPETERFASFLKRRLDTAAIADLYLGEVLDFELAANRLQARARQGAAVRENGRETKADEPLTALAEFDHDPLPLLGALADRQRPEPEPARGQFFVELDASGEKLQLHQVELDRG